MSESIVQLKISSVDKLTEHWIAEGERMATERIIKLLEEHELVYDERIGCDWCQTCRSHFLENHLIALIKGEK